MYSQVCVYVSTAVSHSAQLVHYLGLAADMAVKFFHQSIYCCPYTCTTLMKFPLKIVTVTNMKKHFKLIIKLN